MPSTTWTGSFAWREGAVHWERRGVGPPVVLCHGTPWSSRLWDGLADALAADWTVYRWDMIGYGRSDQRGGQDVSLAAQGELFANLLDHWELHRPAVVAHDYGGAVALRAHLLHARAFRSLILVDVVALSPWGSAFFRLVGDHAEVFEQLPPGLHRALVHEYIGGASHCGLQPDELQMLSAPWLGDRGQAAFYRQIAQADRRHTDAIEARYPTLTVPTHVVWGAEDTWIPLEHGRRLAERIPGAGLTVIPDAGHLVQLDAPDALHATVRGLLTSLPGAS